MTKQLISLLQTFGAQSQGADNYLGSRGATELHILTAIQHNSGKTGQFCLQCKTRAKIFCL